MKRKQKFILIGGIILAILTLYYFKPPVRIINFFLRENCESKGGVFGIYLYGSIGDCYPRHSDVGKECVSNNECQGLCLADLPDFGLKKITEINFPVKTTGKCSESGPYSGCGFEVENGEVNGWTCR